MQSWIDKYQPRKFEDLIADRSKIEDIKEYLDKFPKVKKRALILYGPCGSGKTSTIYTFAREMDYEIVEVNASDFRNADKIKSVVGNASKQMSLFMKKKVILIDEVDGLSGRDDRGGVGEITKIIDNTSFPIICTANNPFDKSLANLRKKANMIEFEELDHVKIYEILIKICERENVQYDESALKQLSRQASGDIRAAINDLQSVSSINEKINLDSIADIDYRERTASIIDALLKIFKTGDTQIALHALDDVEEDFDKSLLWIDENLPKEYDKSQDLQRAYEFLSRSNVFRGRIRRSQYWRLLVYVIALMTTGISVSKDEKYKKFVPYKPTTRILKMWRANMKFLKRKTIAEKIAEKTHTSTKRVIQDILPYIQMMMKKNIEERNNLTEYFEFNKEEVTWMVTN